MFRINWPATIYGELTLADLGYGKNPMESGAELGLGSQGNSLRPDSNCHVKFSEKQEKIDLDQK